MTRGKNDHQLKIGATTDEFVLMRDDQGRAMYQVTEDVPQSRSPLSYIQVSWLGGHGQHTKVTPDMYFEGQSIDTTQPGRVFLGPLIVEVKEADDTDLDGPPICFRWSKANTQLIVATAGKVYRYNVGSNLKWTAATTAVAGVSSPTGGLVEFGTKMYAALGTGTIYMTSTNNDTWTATNLSEDKAVGFLPAPNPAGTSNVIWKWKTPNEITSTTNGQSGGVAWESISYIGDSSYNIISMFLVDDMLMVGREDNLYYYDTDGGVHPVMDELKYNNSANNFKYVVKWQGSTIVSVGDGLLEISSGGVSDRIGPLFNTGDISKVGTVVGLAADNDYVYCAMDEGTNTIIYKGREVRRGEGLRWEWCPWIFLGTKTCSALTVVNHTATDRRLWFGYTNTTGYVQLTDNPTDDSLARFATSGWLRMSYDYGSNPNWDKLWQSAVLEVVGGATGETVQVKYRKDTDTSATECIAAATTNGVYESKFSAELASKRIQFEIHLASDTSTATPEVSYFEAKGAEKPTTVRVHEATYTIGDEPSNRAETLRTFFRGGRTSTALIRFADLRWGEKTSGTAGTDFVYCVMEPGYPQEVEVAHEKGRAPELGIKVRLREVNFS